MPIGSEELQVRRHFGIIHEDVGIRHDYGERLQSQSAGGRSWADSQGWQGTRNRVTPDNENAEWERLAAEQFLAGYNEPDAILRFDLTAATSSRVPCHFAQPGQAAARPRPIRFGRP